MLLAGDVVGALALGAGTLTDGPATAEDVLVGSAVTWALATLSVLAAEATVFAGDAAFSEELA